MFKFFDAQDVQVLSPSTKFFVQCLHYNAGGDSRSADQEVSVGDIFRRQTLDEQLSD